MNSIQYSVHLILLLFLSGCNILSSSEINVIITFDEYTINNGESIGYSVNNRKDISVFILMSGSDTNIEKQIDGKWTRLINTLPHHPVFITKELNPGGSFEAAISYDLLANLTYEPEGVYRITYDYKNSKNRDAKIRKVVSKEFKVE